MDALQANKKNETLRRHMLALATPAGWGYTERLTQKSLARYAKDTGLAAVDTVLLIGHGTSLATAMNAECLFADIAGVSARALPAYSFVQNPAAYLKRPGCTLIVGISCSGSTPSVLQGLRAAQKLGAKTMCLSAGGEIALAGASDYRVAAHTETEVLAGVSAYSASHLFLLYSAFKTAVHMGRLNNTLQEAAAARWEEHWRETQAAMACLPDLFARMESVAQAYNADAIDHLAVLGAGPNLGTAVEGALKICEFAWIFCAAEELEDFAHGRFRETDGRTPLFILSPTQATRAKTLDILAGCRIAGIPSVLLTADENDELHKMADNVVAMPPLPHECLTPFLYVFPLWFYAFHYRARQNLVVGERRFGMRTIDADYAKYQKEERRK